MPLLRVSGDVESFDTFEIAKMTDNRRGGGKKKNNLENNPRNWFSRRGGGVEVNARSDGGARRNSNISLTKDVNSNPEIQLDDVVSVDSRSKRSDEDSSICSKDVGRGAPAQNTRRQVGNSSVGGSERTMQRNSYGSQGSFGSPHVSSSYSDNHHHHHNSSNNYTNHHPPIYENVDDLDRIQDDPRSYQGKGMDDYTNSNATNWENNGKWDERGDIPEEDETESMSTMEDSTQQQQQHQKQQQQKYEQRRKSDGDFSGMTRSSVHHFSPPTSANVSNKSGKSSSKNTTTTNTTSNDASNSAYIAQLEAQVSKISFDLATTKSSFDELQLDHRRLQDEKDGLKKEVSSLQEENEQLHMAIEVLKKEKLVLNMQRTSGVVRSVANSPSSFGANGSSAEDTNMIKTYRMKTSSDALEVPFHSSSNYACNDGSFHEGYYTDGDNDVSVAGSDVDSVALSMHSMDLMEHHSQQPDLKVKGENEVDVSETSSQARLQGRGFMSFIGGGKNASKRNVQDSDDVSVASSNAEDRIKLIQSSHRNIATSLRNGENTAIQEEDDEDYEEYDENDPFATCYPTPDKRNKRNQRDGNWFQRGFGGGGDKNNNKGNVNGKKSAHRPQSEDVAEDPFATCTNANGDDDHGYTSFANNRSMSASERSEESDGDKPLAQERRGPGFQLFRGRQGRKK